MLRQQVASDPLLRDLDSTAGVTRLVHKPPAVDFEFVINRIAPPAHEIAKRVLHASHKDTGFNNGVRGGVMEDLLESWENMHFLRTVEETGPLAPLPLGKKSLAIRSLCFRVGHCMCGEAMAQRRRFRKVLTSQLRQWFTKGSRGRQLYDAAHSILRVSRPDLSHACHVVSASEISMTTTLRSNLCMCLLEDVLNLVLKWLLVSIRRTLNLLGLCWT